jgi:hypothetical protein
VTDPLRDIPGPFLARFTRLWLLRQYVKGDFQKTNLELHERYGMFPNICGVSFPGLEPMMSVILGSIVRIAPNQYSVDSPDAAKVIYEHGSDFMKVSTSMWMSYQQFRNTEHLCDI